MIMTFAVTTPTAIPTFAPVDKFETAEAGGAADAVRTSWTSVGEGAAPGSEGPAIVGDCRGNCVESWPGVGVSVVPGRFDCCIEDVGCSGVCCGGGGRGDGASTLLVLKTGASFRA